MAILISHALLNVLLVSAFNYTYYGTINNNGSSPYNLLNLVHRHIHGAYIDKARRIFYDKEVFGVLKNRYFNDFDALVNRVRLLTNGNVLVVYLPLGWDADLHAYGSNLFRKHLERNHSGVDYVDIYKEVFDDKDEYKVSHSDAHLSESKNSDVADVLSSGYFDKLNLRPTGYNINNYKEIRCFFLPNEERVIKHWVRKINSQGCRMSTNISVDNLSNKFRVLLIGDSISVPWSVNIDKGFPYLLENKHKNIYIVNAAKNAVSHKSYLGFVDRYSKSIQPNLTIIQVQLGSIYSMFYDVPWNKRKASEPEMNFVEEMQYELNAFICLFFMVNLLFVIFSVLYFKTKRNHDG